MSSYAAITRRLSMNEILGENAKDSSIEKIFASVASHNIMNGKQIGTEMLLSEVSDHNIGVLQQIDGAIQTIDPPAATPLKDEEEKYLKELKELRTSHKDMQASSKKEIAENVTKLQKAPIPKEALTAFPQIPQRLNAVIQQSVEFNEKVKDYILTLQQTQKINFTKYKRIFNKLFSNVEDGVKQGATPPMKIEESIGRTRLESSVSTRSAGPT